VVWLWERFTLGIRGFDAGIGPVSFVYKIGEKSELADGAPNLAMATRFREAGLLGGAGDECGDCGLDAGGYIAQELGF
jgi:hypothetical protein